MAIIRTLNGDISANQLGVTYSHDHIYCIPPYWAERQDDDLLLDDPQASEREPFCARKCLYCDFLSFRALASVHEAYTEQLIREIEVQGACCREYQVKTVFIGGGTPSVMEPCLIRDIMQALNRNFDIAGDAEITIEVNPGTLLQNKLHIYRAAGINRLSIGLQSADNQELKDLGRIHTFEEFLKSYQCARMAGFTNVNVDLMSSIPGQTLESWKNTLKKVTTRLSCAGLPDY